MAKAPVAFLLPLLTTGLVLLLFSQASPLSPAVFDFLFDMNPVVGYALAAFTILLMVLFQWKKMTDRVSCMITLVFITCSSVLLFCSLPCIVPPVIVLLTAPLLQTLAAPAQESKGDKDQQLLENTMALCDWFRLARNALLFPAVGCLLLWTVWIVMRLNSGEIDWWTDWTHEFRDRVREGDASWKIAFVEWAVPLGISAELFLMALLYWIQSRLSMKSQEAGGQQDSPDVDYIVSKVKLLGVLVVMAGMALWVGASLDATGDKEFGSPREDMRDEVMGMSFWILAGISVWLVYNLGGPDQLIAAAKKSKVVGRILEMVKCEWACAGYLLIFAPFLLANALLVRCCASKQKQDSGASSSRDDKASYQEVTSDGGSNGEQTALFKRIADGALDIKDNMWTTPVVIKAHLMALFYVSCAVGVKGITLSLAYTNAMLSSLDVYVVSLTIFLIGTFLFLLPPTPGPPVYGLVGILVTASAQNSGWSKIAAVLWAIGIGFAIKMVFAAVAQKCIGQPLAGNPTIRNMVQMHTVEMRTIAKILEEPRITAAKVSILIGGPDWPVAVLCGMLKLGLTPIMIGLSPVLFQSVIPCVLSGAMMVLFGADDSKKALGETALALAGGLQLAALLVAGYYIQDTLEKNYEELSKEENLTDEDRKAVELEKEAAEQQQRFDKATEIDTLPCHIKSALVLGLFCGIVSCCLLAGPWKALIGHTAFKKFEVTSDLDEVLGGDPLSVVRPLGRIAIGFSVLTLLSLLIFKCWSRNKWEGL